MPKGYDIPEYSPSETERAARSIASPEVGVPNKSPEGGALRQFAQDINQTKQQVEQLRGAQTMGMADIASGVAKALGSDIVHQIQRTNDRAYQQQLFQQGQANLVGTTIVADQTHASADGYQNALDKLMQSPAYKNGNAQDAVKQLNATWNNGNVADPDTQTPTFDQFGSASTIHGPIDQNQPRSSLPYKTTDSQGRDISRQGIKDYASNYKGITNNAELNAKANENWDAVVAPLQNRALNSAMDADAKYAEGVLPNKINQMGQQIMTQPVTPGTTDANGVFHLGTTWRDYAMGGTGLKEDVNNTITALSTPTVGGSLVLDDNAAQKQRDAMNNVASQALFNGFLNNAYRLSPTERYAAADDMLNSLATNTLPASPLAGTIPGKLAGIQEGKFDLGLKLTEIQVKDLRDALSTFQLRAEKDINTQDMINVAMNGSNARQLSDDVAHEINMVGPRYENYNDDTFKKYANKAQNKISFLGGERDKVGIDQRLPLPIRNSRVKALDTQIDKYRGIENAVSTFRRDYATWKQKGDLAARAEQHEDIMAATKVLQEKTTTLTKANTEALAKQKDQATHQLEGHLSLLRQLVSDPGHRYINSNAITTQAANMLNEAGDARDHRLIDVNQYHFYDGQARALLKASSAFVKYSPDPWQNFVKGVPYLGAALQPQAHAATAQEAKQKANADWNTLVTLTNRWTQISDYNATQEAVGQPKELSGKIAAKAAEYSDARGTVELADKTLGLIAGDVAKQYYKDHPRQIIKPKAEPTVKGGNVLVPPPPPTIPTIPPRSLSAEIMYQDTYQEYQEAKQTNERLVPHINDPNRWSKGDTE